jgi:hypothetical protein
LATGIPGSAASALSKTNEPSLLGMAQYYQSIEATQVTIELTKVKRENFITIKYYTGHDISSKS